MDRRPFLATGVVLAAGSAPGNVTAELPKAMAAFRDQGLTIPMITTAILSAKDPQTRPILSAATKLAIGYYKLGYCPYKDVSHWKETMDSTHRELVGMAALNRELNIRAGMHNHAANSVGCAMWDGWEVLQGVLFRSCPGRFRGREHRLQSGFPAGPISLHIEYDPGGSGKTERYDRSLAAADHDLKFLRKHLA